MKKIARSDTVVLEGSRKMCVESVHVRVSPGFFGKANCENSRITLVKKWTKISRYFKSAIRAGYGFFYPEKTKIPGFLSRKNPMPLSRIPDKVFHFSLYLTFTISSRIFPSQIFTKKNGVVQPDIPEGR